ncbi:MAG: hypothetical protein M5U35_05270 [Roseovarius sp.]|nr:hypothetical protein [Roseovarius sp.]
METGEDEGATETGAIWPEICEILDEWILDGRPDRLIHIRYQELVGRNWLTLEDNEPYRNLPTELTRAAIGVPSHDLRTLAADYMRRHDPAHAADVIATHLGHGTRKAGESYRAECEGAAAQAIWQESRATIATQAERSAGKRKARNRAAKGDYEIRMGGMAPQSIAVSGCRRCPTKPQSFATSYLPDSLGASIQSRDPIALGTPTGRAVAGEEEPRSG